MFDSAIDLLVTQIAKTEQKVRSARAKEAWKQRKEKLEKTAMTPAVAYIRASCLQRNAQRERIEAYAQNHGFKIIRSYEDVGTTGRQQYRKMLAHARDGEFTAIVGLDPSRFGRLDRDGVAEAMKSFRDAGVEIHTVLEGESEWTTFTT